MRLNRANERRGIILMVVLSLLTLFAIVGVSFVLYASSEATSARVFREAETAQRADVEPEQALALFLGQFLYDVPDDASNTSNLISGLRGHSLARTMYGFNYTMPSATQTVSGANLIPFSGVGRLHYPGQLGQDDYTLVNYTWFSGDGFVRDPERYGMRPTPGGTAPAAQTNFYVGGNAPYTYPDLNNFYLAAVKADGTVLTPSFHRPWLFQVVGGKTYAFNDVTNPNWTNVQGKYLTLRPRPNEHPNFPFPDDSLGDVKNLPWAPGGNDSIWTDIGAPVMTAPDGTRYKMLVAPLIFDLDGRINLGTAGNILGPNNTHVSNQGWGGWEVNLAKVLYADQNLAGMPPTLPTEYQGLILGKATGTGAQKVYGKYGMSGTPTTPGASATTGTPAHSYAPGDVNALNEVNAATSSSRPLPPGSAAYPFTSNPNPNPATNPYASFQQGYFSGGPIPSGGTELTNHPMLYNLFRPAWYNSTDDRIFHPSDMESLLRPNLLVGAAPVDTGSSGLLSDLIRLCPSNFGPSASSPRFRNMVTTLSMDLGVPGVSPYWWNGMPATAYLTPNLTNPLLAPFATTAVPFPTLPPTATVTTSNGSSEFGPDWRAASANPGNYVANNPFSYLSPGGRIRLNRPLPPYPHMGAGASPPYQNQPANPQAFYGVAYNLSQSAVVAQYTAALNARQALANDIYRRLLAITGVFPVSTPGNPQSTDLAPRRWLAQLAVNIVDFIDEDDICTPFNFYTSQDAGGAFTPATTIQGTDDPIPTGANPIFWVFGTELPKVVLNEALAQATNPNPAMAAAATESVKVWLELFNTMPTTVATNTQPQDAYRVPLYMTNPAGGGYSPYRISICQTLMNQPPPTFSIPNPPPAGSLPDASANVLGKGYLAAPLPQSTTDVDFSAVVPLSQGGGATQAPFTVPASGNIINAGVDPGNYFLIGPKTVAGYQNPFVFPGLPNNIPVLSTDSVSYTPTAVTWPAGGTTDERTTGLTVMLRRLANPYMPLQVNPALPNYNPYLTVDYIQNIPIQSNTPNPPAAPFASRGKTQPYAALTQVPVMGGVPQAPANSVTNPTSPVVNQQSAAPINNVTSTFGLVNAPLPPSGQYDWLVQLDRPVISPIELLHVSGYQPYQLTQQFILGSDNLSNAANMVNPPLPANALNLFGHYAPWLDAPPAGMTVANMVCPWWFDSTPNFTPGGPQSHRLYRLFEFFESGDWATGVNGLGRIPGRVNINTIWDPEILQALIDANPSMGMTSMPSQNPPNMNDPIALLFNNLIQSRSPNAKYNMAAGTYSGMIGPVNMGTGTDDRPFLPLSAGLNVAQPGTQYLTGTSVITDTLLRISPTAGTPQLLLFQNPGAPSATPPIPPDTAATHPYLQTQLLTKLYNNITTRSNTFAVFLTVGFFEVERDAAGNMLTAINNPNIPRLGAEIGRREGRQVRHRMFAIVDRTNLSVFSTTSTTSVTGPTIPTPANGMLTNNPLGSATITLNAVSPFIAAGTQLVIEPGTANEETVIVQAATTNANTTQVTANFLKQHPNQPLTGNGGPYQVIIRGNPGPQTSGYNPRNDTLVVPYFSIID